MNWLDAIKQRKELLYASIDTEFEVWVSFEVGKYWHEDVPDLLRYIDDLEKHLAATMPADWNDPAMDIYDTL